MKSTYRLLPALLLILLAALALPLLGPTAGARAAEEEAATERGRKNAIKGLKRKIRKLAVSPWRDKPEKIQALHKHLEALAALGGKEAGSAALAALPHPDKGIRDEAMGILEREHDSSHLKPLVAILEDKAYRRDADARRRVAHALSVVGDTAAIEPLADLLRFDEDAEVVAEAADALSGFPTAPLKLRKIAVRRLVDLYESTWNLKESVKAAQRDKILRKQATKKYKVYGKSLRFALQSLTGAQLTRPQEWRDWWNDNKKRPKWSKSR